MTTKTRALGRRSLLLTPLVGAGLMLGTGTALAAGPTLRSGARGGDVQRLQQRLLDLKYWHSGADGKFGASTVQAVYALQKAAGLGTDGVVGPKTWAALDRGVQPARRITSGTGIEVSVGRNLLVATVDGAIAYILNTSTASGQRYKSRGTWKTARTPGGDFRVYRRVRGWETGELGRMYRPAYFNGGYAIHGSGSIPPYGASHGCARVSTGAMDMIYGSGLVDNGDRVLVY